MLVLGTRHKNNLIHKLKNDSGDWVDWDHGLANVIVDYFSGIFASSEVSWQEVIECIHPTIKENDNLELLQEITWEEVRKAQFSMNPDKTPGPDGMTFAFYQKYWHVVGRDVIQLVRDFFVPGTMPVNLNDTNLVLIPKKKNPTTMDDLRPIALCNVLCKVITKVLANRVKGLLDKVISDTQSAFIPGRLITYNILISFEVLHYLEKEETGARWLYSFKVRHE